MMQIRMSRKQIQTHIHREQTCGCQGDGGFGRGKNWEFGVSRCKLLYIGWINNKDLHRELHSVSCNKPSWRRI